MEGSSERQQPGWQQGGSTEWMVSNMYVCFPQEPTSYNGVTLLNLDFLGSCIVGFQGHTQKGK